MLVEDEPSIADNIIYALKTEGFAPTWCQTAADGLRAFAEHAFALVILDVGLPDMNGFELCKKMRAGSFVPIIFVTARKDETFANESPTSTATNGPTCRHGFGARRFNGHKARG